MSFDLEQKIGDVTQQSWRTFTCIDEGPRELRGLSPDLRHLSEALQLLSNEARSISSVFQTATERQARELRTALDACGSSCSTLSTIASSLNNLTPDDRSHFHRETSLAQGGNQYLKARIVSYSTAIRELLIDLQISSTALNEPPNDDVLGRIQTELLAEGVQIENLEPYHVEIRNHLRHLALSQQQPSQSKLSKSPDTVQSLPEGTPMAAISEAPSGIMDKSNHQKITALVNQVASLFDREALRPSAISAASEKAHPNMSSIAKGRSDDINLSSTEYPASKDSLDPPATSLPSRLSAAISSVSFSMNISTKPYAWRPPPARTSSAVFRNLAYEERATGE